MNTYKYYFTTLSKPEKEAYVAMESAFGTMKSEFSVPKLPFERLADIHTMLKLDCPLLFNTDSLNFSLSAGAGSITVRPNYTVKKKEYFDTLSTVEKRLSRILSAMPDGSIFEKERFIHDFIVKSVTYDKIKKQYSHEITGPLCHGIGVCEGMSKTFKLMCDAVGIECICVIGSGVSRGESTGKKWERHMWNLVRQDSQYLAVDVTFDNSLSSNGLTRYDYFNVSDRIMACSHSSVIFPVPAANTEKSDYYSKTKRSFSQSDDIITAVRDAFKAPYVAVFRFEKADTDTVKAKIKDALSRDKRSAKFKSFSFGQDASGVIVLSLTPKECEAGKKEQNAQC